jgi:BASS family bile acid:Na+ symporter
MNLITKKEINKYKILLGLALIFLIAALVITSTGNLAKTGPLVMLFFVSLALGSRGFNATKGLSYTIWIFAAVSAAMFYPQYFVTIGNFKLSLLVVPLLQIIMFGMGSQMSFEDFVGVIKMPKGVIVGVVSHYIIMPLVGFTIAHIFNFPPEIAAGIILIGCVPSGLASNVMSLLAKANIALAVTVGAISTILSPFITPSLMKWLGGQYIEVNFLNMMLDILNMIILPIVAGFIFNLFVKKETTLRSKIIQLVSYLIIIILTSVVFAKAKNADMSAIFVFFSRSMGFFYILPMIVALFVSKVLKGDKHFMGKVLSFISMFGIAAIVTVITASGRNSLLQVGALLMITSLLHNLTGYTLGYSLSWLFKMPERDRRTIAFEVGMQNGGLASGLALQMGKVATVGLAPAVFGPLMNITGSILANFWRGKSSKDENFKNDSD